jgi:hypothetical protein
MDRFLDSACIPQKVNVDINQRVALRHNSAFGAMMVSIFSTIRILGLVIKRGGRRGAAPAAPYDRGDKQ